TRKLGRACDWHHLVPAVTPRVVFPDVLALPFVFARAALRALVALGVVEVAPRHEHEAFSAAGLLALVARRAGERGFFLDVVVAVLLDVAAVEIGDVLGHAQRD